MLLSVSYDIASYINSADEPSECKYTYSYNARGAVSSLSLTSVYAGGSEDYEYDLYNRLSLRTLEFIAKNGSYYKNDISYAYMKHNNNENRTSGVVETYTSVINDSATTTYTYDYDANGNVTNIVDSAGKRIRYVYDDLGQLIREDNEPLDATYVFEYDDAGNMTYKKKYDFTTSATLPDTPNNTYTYVYPTGTWGDLLTSFNGTDITYDGIGNPLSYYNGTAYTFTWEGRQLLSAVTGGKTYTFTYNSEGIRTSKNALGVVTNYYLNGSQIVAEETSGNVTVYLYDASGSPIGMQYHKATDAEDVWEVYWFEKNLQGDIIAVYSSNATKLVSYSYDAWGYFKTTYHNGGASTQAAKNPFRYRGYYYDLDLGLYYLNSRYYDCNTGRFINADKFVSTGQGFTGYNMFAYCNNNPISYVDSTGTIAKALVVAGGGFLILAALCIIASSQPAEQVPSASPAPPLSLPTKEDLLMPLAFLGALLSMIGEKEEAKEEVTTAPPPSSTVIYRYGKTDPEKFVPSPEDVATNSGLSFSTRPPRPGVPASVTTIEALNATGVVKAYEDRPGHVRVDPVVGTLAEWRDGGTEHPCTIAIASVVVEWGG